jgi:hypothetical protein
MTLCRTHEPNHEIRGYHAPITGNFVCDHCGAGYCSCNEDLAKCELCPVVDYYDNMVDGFSMLPEILEERNLGYHDYVCLPCYELQVSKLNKRESKK